MKNYQFYIFGRSKDGIFCRLIFRLDDEGHEVFVRAESKTILEGHKSMSHIEANNFIKNNKIRLIDEFKTRL